MHWYLNDASLQGQFASLGDFESVLRELFRARAQIPAIRQNLRITRSLREAMVAPQTKVSRAVSAFSNRDMRAAMFSWLDKTGPFVDSDRLNEDDDYFEYAGVDITETGLGEATRRTKAGTECTAYSFVGGVTNYEVNPLEVDHGLPEERYGQYRVPNLWQTDLLVKQARSAEAPIRSWHALFEAARKRFPNIEIGTLHTNPALAREPFAASLRDRSLELMKILDDYVSGRNENGTEGPEAREIVETYFTGDRALFSGESPTNQNQFARQLTFKRISGGSYFGHWHGKISYRFFRMHFEWPLEKDRKKLEIFYLGPKITKK